MKLRLIDTIVIILAAWAGLAWLSHVLGAGVEDIVEIYPLSLFMGPKFGWAGVPYAFAFLVVLWIALRLRPSVARAWMLGLTLIVLGNLIQGGFRAGMVLPLAGKTGSHYISASRRITDVVSWLWSFNGIQHALFRQPKTHPPFATLLFHLLRTPAVIAIAFTLLASLSIPLVGRAMRAAGASASRAGECALLFALIPAINIYGGASLDGVVLAASSLFLLGLTVLCHRDAVSWPATAMLAAGLIVANALTFGGLFLVAVGVVFAVRHRTVRTAMLVSAAVALAAYMVLRLGFGYDHVEAFITATRAENPSGFQALAHPLHYFLTRLENVGNIAVFLSVPVLAVLLRRRPDPMTLTAAAVLSLMFLAGAYRTGETARACLFVYPFLMLGLKDLPAIHMRWLTLAAAIQTLAMQVLGAYGA